MQKSLQKGVLVMSPARSKAQRVAMAIALHKPNKLYERNKGLKEMSQSQLHDFVSTSEKELPKKKKPHGWKRSGSSIIQ